MHRSALATLVVAVIATGCASSGGVSGTSGTDARDVLWDARRPLRWDDFRGPVDTDATVERAAMTAATLRWNYGYALERDAGACRYWIDNVSTEAVFNRYDSWVRPGFSTDAILGHEQGHFDLTQIFKRALDSRTAGLVGQRSPCTGETLEDAVASAERGAAAQVQSVFDDVWERYVATQALYDDRTHHGTRESAQALWNRAIAAALATGRWQPPP